MTVPADAQWFTCSRKVAWSEVDPSGNYRFTAALGYVEEAEIALLRHVGVIDALYPQLPRTFVHADFRVPARFGDVLSVDVRPIRVGRSALEFGFRLRRGDRLCAEGVLGSALVGEEGRARQLPAWVRARLGECSGTDHDTDGGGDIGDGGDGAGHGAG